MSPSADKDDNEKYADPNLYLTELAKALINGDHESSDRFKQVFALRRSLEAETDRGCALMVGAYLDDLLKDFLASLFVDDSNISKSFLRADGPLGTFSSRIELCYLLGQTSKAINRELNLLRKIRNDFAHSADLINFAEPSIHDRIRQLSCTGLSSDADPRHRIIRSSLFIAAEFHSMMWSGRRLNSPPDPNLDTINSVAAIVAETIAAIVAETMESIQHPTEG